MLPDYIRRILRSFKFQGERVLTVTLFESGVELEYFQFLQGNVVVLLVLEYDESPPRPHQSIQILVLVMRHGFLNLFCKIKIVFLEGVCALSKQPKQLAVSEAELNERLGYHFLLIFLLHFALDLLDDLFGHVLLELLKIALNGVVLFFIIVLFIDEGFPGSDRQRARRSEIFRAHQINIIFLNADFVLDEEIFDSELVEEHHSHTDEAYEKSGVKLSVRPFVAGFAGYLCKDRQIKYLFGPITVLSEYFVPVEDCKAGSRSFFPLALFQKTLLKARFVKLLVKNLL